PNGEDIFYYLTVYNEPYQQPAEPEGLDVDGLLKGLYRYRAAETPAAGDAPPAQILASGVGGRCALEAQRLLADDWGGAADVWAATWWNGRAREGGACDEWNMLNPDAGERVPYVPRPLGNVTGPVVAVAD